MLISPPMNGIENATEEVSQSNLGKGILGALLGAAVGVGVMFAFYTFAGFRFPLLGVGIGILTAYGARLLFKGGDSKLAVIASGIALCAVVATFVPYVRRVPNLEHHLGGRQRDALLPNCFSVVLRDEEH